ICQGDEREVLIINNKDECIMEASRTTTYFWRNNRWVTPPVSRTYCKEKGSSGQDGTTRRWALESGHAVEDVIHIDSLVQGEECGLINGARGFMCGKIDIGKVK
ncbi:hypothetical protein EDB81DRAFT_657716, partial [Dactylonectria macrodidyma]